MTTSIFDNTSDDAVKYPKYNQDIKELKQMIDDQHQGEVQRILEIGKAFEEAGTMPKNKIASRIIHDFKKALKERIEELQAEINYLEERRYNTKAFVNKYLPDEYKEEEKLKVERKKK